MCRSARRSQPWHPSSHHCARAARQATRRARNWATTGRWSLPAPSSEPMTRNPMTFQPSVAMTWSIGVRQELRQHGRPGADGCVAGRLRGIVAGAELGFADLEAREVVESRVEVAGQDDVGRVADPAQPGEAVPPFRELPGDGGDRMRGDDRRPGPVRGHRDDARESRSRALRVVAHVLAEVAC